jgi:hypothetical protein
MSSPSSSNCNNYKTVTIQPGEAFTLPPGAEIIGVSNPAHILSSTCPIPTNLEPFLCYGLQFWIGSGNETSGGETPQGKERNLYAIKLNGIQYSFPSPILLNASTSNPAPFTTSLRTQLDLTPVGGIITDLCTGVYVDEGSTEGRGDFLIVTFRSIPSLMATDAFLMTSVPSLGPLATVGATYQAIPIFPRASLTDSADAFCPCTNP